MTITILTGCCLSMLSTLPEQSIQTCVTSPPYYALRDYGVAGQIGLEPTPDEFIHSLVSVFRGVRRVLKDDGTLWVNLGDTYAARAFPDQSQGAIKAKDLMGIPWRLAFALQADGWYLRRDIIWQKLNPMPESIKDRPTSAHEYIFLLSKMQNYYYDQEAIKEDATESDGRLHGIVRDRLLDYDSKHRVLRPSKKRGEFAGKTQALPGREAFRAIVEKRNKRSVWTMASSPFSEAHFATYPPKLIEPCILAGSRPGDTVLDPFFGAGTTGLVADRLGRDCIGIELNPEYVALAERRLKRDSGMFAEVMVVA